MSLPLITDAYTINSPQFTGGVLRATWSRPAVPHELSSFYEELLVCARESGNCRFWLLDLSQRNWAEPSFLQWLGQEFVGQATAALGGPIFVAFLIAPQHLSQLKSSYIADIRCRATEVNFYFTFFENAALAVDWLRDQQELLSATIELLVPGREAAMVPALRRPGEAVA